MLVALKNPRGGKAKDKKHGGTIKDKIKKQYGGPVRKAKY